MFDVGKTYWITFTGTVRQVVMKAVVLSENDHLIKVRTDSGKESFIPQNKLLEVNLAKEEDQIIIIN